MGAHLGGAKPTDRYAIAVNSQINVTPFVDVMLVLLIVLMVSAPLATTAIKLDMPPAAEPTPPVEPPLFVSIDAGDRLYIGRGALAPEATTLADLTADLRARVGGADPTAERVFVRADANVEYDRFMQVLNALKADGFDDLGLVSEDIR